MMDTLRVVSQCPNMLFEYFINTKRPCGVIETGDVFKVISTSSERRSND